MRRKLGRTGLALVLALIGCMAGAEGELRDYHQIVTIEPDGSILVEESFTAVWDGEFTLVNTCLFPEQPGEIVSFVGPGPEASADQELTVSRHEEYGCLLVEAHTPAPTTEHRLSYAYRIEGAMTAFGDVVSWSRDMRSLDSITIHDYSLTLTFPGTFEFPYLAKHRTSSFDFLNPPTTPVETYETVEGADGPVTRYHLEIEEIPFNHPITVDLLLPPDAFLIKGEGEQLHYLIGQLGPVPYPLNHAFRLPTETLRLSEEACRERLGELWGMLANSILQTTSPPTCYLAPTSSPVENYRGIRVALREGNYDSAATAGAVLTPGASYSRYEHKLMNHYLIIVSVRDGDDRLWLVSMGLKP